jgi:hypothetical protein
MLHWAKSFSAIALMAGVFALGAFASAFGTAAMAVAAVFAALAALAVVTGVLGRRGDGTYSAERAVWLVALAIGLVLTARWWVESGMTIAEARAWIEAIAHPLAGELSARAAR